LQFGFVSPMPLQEACATRLICIKGELCAKLTRKNKALERSSSAAMRGVISRDVFGRLHDAKLSQI